MTCMLARFAVYIIVHLSFQRQSRGILSALLHLLLSCLGVHQYLDFSSGVSEKLIYYHQIRIPSRESSCYSDLCDFILLMRFLFEVNTIVIFGRVL